MFESGPQALDLHQRGVRAAAVADARGAKFRDADMTGVRLSSADLTGADLHGADLSRAHIRRTNFSGADLSDVSGLDERRLSQACGDAVTKLRNFVR